MPRTVAGENQHSAWRAGTAMAERAQRARAAESLREAPKTWTDIYNLENAYENGSVAVVRSF